MILAAAVLTHAPIFFSSFPAAGLIAAEDLG